MVHCYPTSHCHLSCNFHDSRGVFVYIMRLEEDEIIEGEFHQECSKEDGWKARHKSSPVMLISLVDWIFKDMISQKYMYTVGTVSFAGMMTVTNFLVNFSAKTYSIDVKQKVLYPSLNWECYFKETIEQNKTYHGKKDTPSYHGMVRGWRFWWISIAHSLISLPWKSECHI